MRRRCCLPIRSKKKPLLCILFIFLIINLIYKTSVFFLNLPQDVLFANWQKEWSCTRHSRQKILSKLCSAYFHLKVGGNLCHDLCVAKELNLPGCISHKNTTTVFMGKWKDKAVVFKTKKSSRSFEEKDIRISYILSNSDQDVSNVPGHYLDQYTDFIYEHVFSEVPYEKLRKQLSPKAVLMQMYHPHPLSNFSFADMRSLWQLLQQEEFIKLQLLQSMKHIPRVYGFCGTFYAVERAESLEDYFNMFLNKKPKPWSKRVRVALGLLGLVEEFKRTALGKLHHCDIQPGNFGVGQNGNIVALDIDTVFTSPQINEYMAQGNCSENQDCTLFDCMSVCDRSSKICTSNIVSNNLQNICLGIFVSDWVEPGILKRSPIFAANKLDPVLNECTAESKYPWKQEKENRILNELTDLLQEDLHK